VRTLPLIQCRQDSLPDCLTEGSYPGRLVHNISPESDCAWKCGGANFHEGCPLEALPDFGFHRSACEVPVRLGWHDIQFAYSFRRVQRRAHLKALPDFGLHWGACQVLIHLVLLPQQRRLGALLPPRPLLVQLLQDGRTEAGCE